jgi:thioredoxin-like negative regulator of GroEL
MKIRSFLAVSALAIAGLFSLTGPTEAKDFPKGSPSFETDYEKAVKLGAKEGKPVLLVFSAVWCGPCQTNKKDVYPAAAVKPYHDKFVWAYIDADLKENRKVMKEFGVNGIPHIQFLDKDGKAVDKFIGGTTPDAFVKVLDSALEKAGTAKTEAKEAKKEATEKKEK